jgi:hypothetical protein
MKARPFIGRKTLPKPGSLTGRGQTRDQERFPLFVKRRDRKVASTNQRVDQRETTIIQPSSEGGAQPPDSPGANTGMPIASKGMRER